MPPNMGMMMQASMIVGATTWLGTTWDLIYNTLPRPTCFTFVQVRGGVCV